MRRRVVVTGIGVITPLGNSVAEFWNQALAGTTAWSPVPEHWSHYGRANSTIWAPLPSRDYSPWGVSRIDATQLDRGEQIALACARQALDDAGISYELEDEKKNTFGLTRVDPESFGVFIGTGIGGATSLCAAVVHHVAYPAVTALASLHKDLAHDGADAHVVTRLESIRAALRVPTRFNPFSVPMAMPNGLSAIIGIRYGLHGRNATNAGACAAGTIAIGHALRAIRSGEMPVALAGGVEYLGDDWGGIFHAFDVVQTLVRAGDDPASANRPFDEKRSGFLFAEGGGAVLVLEELEHARPPAATIVAEVTGYGETFDAHSVMMLEPSGVHMEKMVHQALGDAGVTAADIDYVNAHGTSTVLNDETESAMLGRVFGNRPLVNSTKGLVGHTIGASGAIEAAVTALSLRDQTTHVCANLDAPINGLRYVRDPGPYPMARALSESFAFGGHNAALVLEAFRP
jgi:3-oxoacyl-[acyl-carrier-protein] synthase II